MFKECVTFQDQAECVDSLAARCSFVLSQFEYAEVDVRFVSISNVRLFSRNGQMILNLLEAWTTPNEEVSRNIARLVNIVEVTPENVRLAANMLNTTSRLSLVVLSQFQIEHCLRSIAEKLGINIARPSFYTIAKALLEFLRLPKEMLDQLNTPALIRNSLHANGIHHGYQGKSTVVEIDGVSYEFLDGAPVDCANWQHIAHVIENSIGVLERIFQSREIRKLADPICDPFVGTL